MEDVKWLEVTLDTTEAELDALCARLTGNGVTGLAIEDEEDFKTFLEQNHQYWDYVDDGLLARMKGVCRVKFYITDDADGRKQLEGWLAGIDQPYSLASLGDNDWAHSWQKYYKPMPVGERLYIVPEWERGEPVPAGKAPLYLNPGLTFGTGSHASTQLCLMGLERYTVPGKPVLDLGCGSGILSIAALVLGASAATAVDIDPKAVDVAYENAALNGIGRDRYNVRAGNVLTDGALVAELARQKYALVLANIVADVIIPLSARAGEFLDADGVFLCSGIIDRLADGKAVIDYGFHGVLQHVDERVLREMGELADREGITSFKAYLTYDFGLDDGALFQVLRQAKEDGIVIPAHCENDGVVNYLRGWYKAQGLTQPIYHARSRPARCEAEAVSRLLHLAAMAGEAPVYVVHLSSAAGLAEVRKARAQRQKGVGVETCTQYLTLTEAAYADPQEGLKAVMSPPLRTQADCDALWQGLQDGVIDAVATDHCPFRFAVEKQFGAGDFTACPNGAPGVEERLPVLYSEGVAKGRLSICELVRLLCANPSRLYGLYPRKGTLQPGADADVVILDPAKRRTLTHAGLHSAVDYTCYEGMELQGAIDLVLSRGEVVARDNQFVGKRGAGRYLKRGHSRLAE